MDSDGVEGADVAWLAVRASALPETWRDRATMVALVAVGRHELALLAAGGSATPVRTAGWDVRLLDLVARGTPKQEMAISLAISARTLDRRLRDLREHFGARTLPELTAMLARQGFGAPRS